MDKSKSCNNCKHAQKSYRDVPCLTCKNPMHVNWEPKEEKNNNDTK